MEQQEPKLDDMDMGEEDEDEEYDENGYTKIDWTQQLIQSCQKGDFETAKKALERRSCKINFEDKKKWTPLIWATCNGYINIVKLLISKGALHQYLPENFEQVKVQLGMINNSIKSTPLQWACFKGHIQLVWLYLKNGLRLMDIDAIGNNCIHLAATAGNYQIFECLISWGATVEEQNTRGHFVIDLATNKDIYNLIQQHIATKTCQQCNIPYQIGEELIQKKKHFCRFCKHFFCDEHYKIDWIFETHECEQPEKFEGRCLDCSGFIDKHEKELQQVMDLYNHDKLQIKLQQIIDQNIEISVKLYQAGIILQEKLRTQDEIKEFVGKQAKVDDYKTILRSVSKMRELVDDADKRGVILDQEIKNLVAVEAERLIAERNLRFALDNIDANACKVEDVKNLSELTEAARDKQVAIDYMSEADTLLDKMQRNITAKNIFTMFNEYPPREYPEIWFIPDPKSKKPLNPWTKKPIDPKKMPPPPKTKKKKREPKFVIPEWCPQITDLEVKIKELEELNKFAEELNLDEVFLQTAVDQIKRMKNEVQLRKVQQIEAEWIAEYKIALKKKK